MIPKKKRIENTSEIVLNAVISREIFLFMVRQKSHPSPGKNKANQVNTPRGKFQREHQIKLRYKTKCPITHAKSGTKKKTGICLDLRYLQVDRAP